MEAGASVNSLDPKSTEIGFTLPAVAIGVGKSVEARFGSSAVETVANTVVSLSLSKEFLVTAARLRAASDAGHTGSFLFARRRRVGRA